VEELVHLLASAEAGTKGVLETEQLEQALAAAIQSLSASASQGTNTDDLVLEALRKARRLILRIGDNSNLTLDPDLDSYYLQDIVVTKLPAWLGQLAELRTLSAQASSDGTAWDGRTIRLLVLDGLLRSSMDGVQDNLASAYRGDKDGRVQEAVGQTFGAMISATRSYVNSVSDRLQDRQSPRVDQALVDRAYGDAVRNVVSAWAAAQSELDRLLHQRIGDFLANMRTTLAVIGALSAISIIIAFLTHRNIVGPLNRFESVANAVRETKDYSLRVDIGGRDEIGRLAGAFNDMLSELSRAHKREAAEQAELARVSRLTTMGAMTASIAHEVNQPLAAIVANSNAALRWLSNREPDLDEASAALKRIVRDGHRASEVIAGVRAMFKKDRSERVSLAVNDLVRDALLLSQGQLQNHRVALQTELSDELPEVLADRVQLQQVLINLVINGAEAMASVADGERLLLMATEADDTGTVRIAVTDSGAGIGPNDLERIFEPFFTTKSSGMGMGLSICRSIVESHGGRLWVASSSPNGTTFYLTLPSSVANG
jgi:C4-dicarboxylate-specific signal transduction histidine kinase